MSFMVTPFPSSHHIYELHYCPHPRAGVSLGGGQVTELPCVCLLLEKNISDFSKKMYLNSFQPTLFSPPEIHADVSPSPFISLLIPLFARAAETLLVQVQKEYLAPQQELAELTEAASQLLSQHNSRLRGAQDLVNEALADIDETNRLFPLISSNLVELNVRLDGRRCCIRNIGYRIV